MSRGASFICSAAAAAATGAGDDDDVNIADDVNNDVDDDCCCSDDGSARGGGRSLLLLLLDALGSGARVLMSVMRRVRRFIWASHSIKLLAFTSVERMSEGPNTTARFLGSILFRDDSWDTLLRNRIRYKSGVFSGSERDVKKGSIL